jgi:glutamyl-tRNA reductase
MNAANRFLLLGASHHTVPLAIREKLAVAPERMEAFYAGLRAVPGLREAVLVSTCNRLELYGVLAPQAPETPVDEFVCRFQDFPVRDFLQRRFQLRGEDAVRHLIEVACGADSQVVGEAEILGQVKHAYATATARAAVGPVINRVFQKVFQATKYIRTATPIGEGQVSIATVAVDLAGKIFGELSSSRVLVIGTGEIGEKTMKALHSRGASAITVLSRTPERAQALAQLVGARPGALDQLSALLPEHDIVIGCTNSPQPVITAAVVQSAQRGRRLRPLFLIDLAVPRNFDAATSGLNSVFLYDLDDLVRIADENLAARRAAISRCRQLAHEKAQRIWAGVVPRLGDNVTNIPERPEALAAREPVT